MQILMFDVPFSEKLLFTEREVSNSSLKLDKFVEAQSSHIDVVGKFGEWGASLGGVILVIRPRVLNSFYRRFPYNDSVSQALGSKSPAPLRDRALCLWLHSNVFYLFTSGVTENVRTPPESQSPDNAHSVAFSQRSSSPHLIEDETFNDCGIINNLMDYEDGQEELDSLRADKNICRDPAFQQILKAFS
ncbi:uncharacterized protein TNCV_121821 [Trichonephila clavipes]|nr:uncharacterized protein TNCV_121821 [Trichonephila clavipes]